MRGYGASGALLGENALYGQLRIELGGQNVTGAQIALEPPRTLKFTLQSTPDCPAAPLSLSLDPLENWAAMPINPVELKPNQEAIVKDIPPARYRIRTAKPDGLCFNPAPFIVDSGDAGPIRLTLQPPGIIEVRLSAPNAVTLTSIDDPTAPARILPPAKEDMYRFDGLRPGRYRLLSGSAIAEVEARPGVTTQATLKEPNP